MCYGAAGAGAAGYAAIAQAIRASGVIVQVEESDFLTILSRTEKPLVVTGQGGVLKKNYQYLTSYKGLAFFTKVHIPLELGEGVELVTAKRICIPQL